MRIERAIDAFLDWRQFEQDATPRSVDSYRRILDRLAGEYPEADIRKITTADLRAFLGGWVRESSAVRGIDLSAATRSNIVSVLHSFFGWEEAEDIIDADPSRKIRRPRKRKPDVYRPSLEELTRLRVAATGHERPPILLMEGVGLRRSEVLGCRWEDIDFDRGRIRVKRKGQHWSWLPIDPDVLRELRISYRVLDAAPDHFVFRVVFEQWKSATERVRRLKDPTQPGSEQALWRLVQRVCERAGIRLLSPHQLRHGFVNRFVRESGRDLVALQALMGHSRPDTTQGYTDDLDIEELADALVRAAETRAAQASSEEETGKAERADGPPGQRWRRRESNPRS
jgi:integrase/recombinase XerC